jgi:hypothetical protein
MAGVPVRDLRMVLDSVKAALENPGLATKLLQLCERDEDVLTAIRDEEHQLRCMREEHRLYLSRAGKEHDQELQRQRDEWSRELAEARKRLAIDENETARRRESVNRDREQAARLREQLEAGKLSRKRPGKSDSAATAACEEHGPPLGCDPGVEQQPTAAQHSAPQVFFCERIINELR